MGIASTIISQPVVLATHIVEKATNESSIVKNPAAVALGRLGGLKSGRVRAERLTP